MRYNDDKGLRKTLNLIQKDLIFDEEPHIYTYKGEIMQSVTTILKPFFPFDAEKVASTLGKRSRNPDYKGKSKEEILDMWQAKRELGTRVHLFIEEFLDGKFVNITCGREKGAFKWLQKWKYTDALTEQQICIPKWGISGMIDCIAKIHGKWYIVDWKTDRSIETTGFGGKMCTGELKNYPQCNFTKYKFQLGIYRYLLEQEEYDIDIAGMIVVHIDADGVVREYTIPYERDKVMELVENFINKKGTFKE